MSSPKDSGGAFSPAPSEQDIQDFAYGRLRKARPTDPNTLNDLAAQLTQLAEADGLGNPFALVAQQDAVARRQADAAVSADLANRFAGEIGIAGVGDGTGTVNQQADTPVAPSPGSLTRLLAAPSSMAPPSKVEPVSPDRPGAVALRFGSLLSDRGLNPVNHAAVVGSAPNDRAQFPDGASTSVSQGGRTDPESSASILKQAATGQMDRGDGADQAPVDRQHAELLAEQTAPAALDKILSGLSRSPLHDPKGESAGLFLRQYKELVRSGVDPEIARQIIADAIPVAQRLQERARQDVASSDAAQEGVQPAILPMIAAVLLEPYVAAAVMSVFAAFAAYYAKPAIDSTITYFRRRNEEDAAAAFEGPLPNPPDQPAKRSNEDEPKPPQLPPRPIFYPTDRPSDSEADRPRPSPADGASAPDTPYEALFAPLLAVPNPHGRPGNLITQQSNRDLADACEEVLKEDYPDLESFVLEGKRQFERYFKPRDENGKEIDGTKKGSSYSDYSLDIRKRSDPSGPYGSQEWNTVTMMKNGKDMVARERRGDARLEQNLRKTGNHIVRTMAKFDPTKMSREEYRRAAREACRDALRDMLGPPGTSFIDLSRIERLKSEERRKREDDEKRKKENLNR